MSKGAMIAVIVAAVLVLGGAGFMWLNSKPAPPPDYKPIMPPSGYQGTASGTAGRRQSGYPGTSGSSGYPSNTGGSAYPSSSGSSGYPSSGSGQ